MGTKIYKLIRMKQIFCLCCVHQDIGLKSLKGVPMTSQKGEQQFLLNANQKGDLDLLGSIKELCKVQRIGKLLYILLIREKRLLYI